MYKSIVFDLGGVMIDFDPKGYLVDRLCNAETEEEVYDLTFGSEEWKLLDAGLISRFDGNHRMLEKARDIRVDQGTYEKLCADLEKGRKLLYLTDNAGEIGFDRIFAEQLQRKFSHLEITFCVRGGSAANDATRADAAAVGLPFPVIDNGNLVAGTVPEQLSDEARQAMEQADVILSKGMGNVETLLGCGKNIYYAFLVKCQRFVNLMERPLMTPLLLRELDRRG